MNVARFIARRYFKAKKSRNVINLITLISVVGIAISTAALVILLSAFNGIEQMVIKLYSDFDPPISIRSAKAKTFNQGFLDFNKIDSVEGVINRSRAIEEVVILKHQDKWVHAQMVGVDTSFLSMSKMEEHLVDGIPKLYIDGKPQAIFGAYLLDKLGGSVPNSLHFQEQITFNVPLREGKIRPGKKPLNVRMVGVSSRMNYNREVNAEKALVPYELANELLEYGEDITALYIDIDEDYNVNEVKRNIQTLVGNDFEVKTNFEKNELIFKTSQSEKLIVYFILVFIFILASFNLIASIAMLFVEKKPDIKTLYAMGANKNTIFRIFFYEGLMIVARGAILGLIIGYAVTFAQITFGMIPMPSATEEYFPMVTTWKDIILIIGSVSLLGFITCYFPTKILIRRHQNLSK
ncbi:ABC transporter permease [Brumimicrobium aurantiacum]|uniref:ABC transporter permease n=1 Tax=Brumimicrobium aurantiacum TaxID=1737063 RepID=A0A3E1F267_9FLAO|nr:FtsX-like permease family protein [Brumimicrobium aurantiacum]RFC55911.1 ABC transporter permease [Brumimicrobium aurantiacum]